MRVLSSFCVALLAVLPAGAETLTVYTYESFVSEWGPGPAIEEAYEEQCSCDLEWVAVDDAVLLLSRLRLEGASTTADVVLGLDTNLTAEAVDAGIVQEHNLDSIDYALPMDWTDTTFVPFDFGYFAVIYDSSAMPEPPATLEDLVAGAANRDLIIQDPRTSTPGLGLLLWIKAIYGDNAADAWARLSSRVLTVTKGWSEAYGLFLDGEAPMVLSYTTSPAYHQIVEEEDRYKAAIFPEGHYTQVEVAAMTAHTDQPDRARDFLEFIGSPGFQKTIPTGNWMYPVIDLREDLPSAFRYLPRPETALLFESDDVKSSRTAWINEWLEAMSEN